MIMYLFMLIVVLSEVKMRIAILMRGESESTDHLIEMDKKELDILMEVFTGYCNINKRKKNALKMLKQFDDQLQIY